MRNQALFPKGSRSCQGDSPAESGAEELGRSPALSLLPKAAEPRQDESRAESGTEESGARRRRRFREMQLEHDRCFFSRYDYKTYNTLVTGPYVLHTDKMEVVQEEGALRLVIVAELSIS